MTTERLNYKSAGAVRKAAKQLTRLCDSNFGERDTSFAPLVAWTTADGRMVIQNTAATRNDGFLGEEYASLAEAAEARGFIRSFLD